MHAHDEELDSDIDSDSEEDDPNVDLDFSTFNSKAEYQLKRGHQSRESEGHHWAETCAVCVHALQIPWTAAWEILLWKIQQMLTATKSVLGATSGPLPFFNQKLEQDRSTSLIPPI